MNDIYRSGSFTYRIDVNWAKLPQGWELVDVADIVVDSNDRVFVNSRGGHPVIIFDRDGNVLSSWGEDHFVRPHGMTIGPDGLLYCTDDGEHTVKKFALNGKLLQTIGTPGKPAELMSGEPFNRPTKVAFEPGTGNLYISDGYGNPRIHKYTPSGERLFSWGSSGTEAGEFDVPHSVCTDRQGFVYVADRENHRIQVFDDGGRYVTQWNNMYRPCGFHITQDDPQLAIIGQNSTSLAVNSMFLNIGSCVSIHELSGKQIARIGAPTIGEDTPDQFHAPHAIAVDSHGDVYVGEVSYTHWGSKQKPPTKPRCLRKFIRLT